MSVDNIFRVELSSDFDQWWRYSIFMAMVCRDAEGCNIDYITVADAPLSIEAGHESRSCPEGYGSDRMVVAESSPCHQIEIHLYIIANTFPESRVVRDSPSFEAMMRILCNGKPVESMELEVNQWGGATVVAHKVTA